MKESIIRSPRTMEEFMIAAEEVQFAEMTTGDNGHEVILTLELFKDVVRRIRALEHRDV